MQECSVVCFTYWNLFTPRWVKRNVALPHAQIFASSMQVVYTQAWTKNLSRSQAGGKTTWFLFSLIGFMCTVIVNYMLSLARQFWPRNNTKNLAGKNLPLHLVPRATDFSHWSSYCQMPLQECPTFPNFQFKKKNLFCLLLQENLAHNIMNWFKSKSLCIITESTNYEKKLMMLDTHNISMNVCFPHRNSKSSLLFTY